MSANCFSARSTLARNSSPPWTPLRGPGPPKTNVLCGFLLSKVVNAYDTDLRALVLAALLTGCRYQELATLQPGDVDLDNGVLTTRSRKSGTPR